MIRLFTGVLIWCFIFSLQTIIGQTADPNIEVDIDPYNPNHIAALERFKNEIKASSQQNQLSQEPFGQSADPNMEIDIDLNNPDHTAALERFKNEVKDSNQQNQPSQSSYFQSFKEGMTQTFDPIRENLMQRLPSIPSLPSMPSFSLPSMPTAHSISSHLPAIPSWLPSPTSWLPSAPSWMPNCNSIPNIPTWSTISSYLPSFNPSTYGVSIPSRFLQNGPNNVTQK